VIAINNLMELIVVYNTNAKSKSEFFYYDNLESHLMVIFLHFILVNVRIMLSNIVSTKNVKKEMEHYTHPCVETSHKRFAFERAESEF